MFLLTWYKQYLDIKAESAIRAKETEFCESCENLKLQLAVANEEKKFLLEKLLVKEEPVKEIEEPKVYAPILPHRRTWSMRQQALEAESRANAKALRDNPSIAADKKGVKLTVSEIEKEIGVANDA